MAIICNLMEKQSATLATAGCSSYFRKLFFNDLTHVLSLSYILLRGGLEHPNKMSARYVFKIKFEITEYRSILRIGTLLAKCHLAQEHEISGASSDKDWLP